MLVSARVALLSGGEHEHSESGTDVDAVGDEDPSSVRALLCSCRVDCSSDPVRVSGELRGTRCELAVESEGGDDSGTSVDINRALLEGRAGFIDARSADADATCS